jgi:hypothetical protein
MNTNLVDLLNEVNLSSAYNIFLPSFKQNIKFKPLTIEQFKTIVDRSAKVPYLNVGFHQELINIIKSNIITEQQDNICNFITELDRAIIAINIRINDVSVTYNNIDLTSKKTEYNNIQFPDSMTLNSNQIIIECGVPSIISEEKYNDYVTKKFNETMTEESAVKDVLNLMLVAEIAKYINKIVISETIYTQTESFDDWVTAVTSLPLSLLNDTINYIDNIKSFRDNLFKLDDNKFIEYNMNLFTAV